MRTLKILMVVLLGATFAGAQASRTWVSGVGDDANPCSRTAPCKTWAGAISKTAPGGEIDALDPGGFGALTITKSITLDGGGGQVASTLVTGTNGIVVAAQPADVVTLRNIRINGIRSGANGGINGIQWQSGAVLIVENCYIFGFTNHGINIAKSDGGKAVIRGTHVTNNGGNGLNVSSSAIATQVDVDNSYFDFNMFGVLAGSFATITVSNSDASGNSQNGFTASGSAGSPELNLANSTASNNAGSGIQAGGGPAAAIVRISGVVLHNNPGGGISIAANGSVKSFGNNYNSGAGAPTAPNLSVQ